MWLAKSLLIAAAMAAGVPALADEPPAAPAKAAAAAGKEAKPKEKLVCTTETAIGSLVPQRVCRSAQQTKDDRSTVEDIQRYRQGSGTPLIGDKALCGALSGAPPISPQR